MRFSILFLLLVSTLTGFSQNMLKFQKAGIPYTISYPSDWEPDLRSGDRAFFTSPSDSEDDMFKENVNIGFKKGKGFTNSFLTADVENSIIDNLKGTFKEFKMENKKHYKFNGSETMDITYTVIMENVFPDKPIRIHQIMFGNQGTLYTLTYTSIAEITKWDATGEKIMKTMVLK